MKLGFILFFILILKPALAQELFDPTRPPVSSSSSSASGGLVESGETRDNASGIPDVKISAIFYSDERRFVIINNEMVSEGEKWKNILLSKINKDSIELKNGDFHRVVKVFNTDVVEERAYVY
ncbi:hypothetical protein [Alteromonas sp. a30]|uniref:hypothetical protein n=1 Tax=Alteromonas sp. a30 TaxID=2730917 RepID=UPI002280A883|nr:hypothetical protein [Alteromonas sp. a30]MCY7295277.1 hypothetical protein [Alteromonas sp. a30]